MFNLSGLVLKLQRPYDLLYGFTGSCENKDDFIFKYDRSQHSLKESVRKKKMGFSFFNLCVYN